MVRGEFKVFEAREKLEYLIAEYLAALARHRIGTTASRLEVVASAATDIGSLGIATALKTAVSLRTDKVKALAGEATIPGTEISYLVSAHQRFSR